MASRLSSREDDLTSPLNDEDTDEEEEVVVKSKIPPVSVETDDDHEEDAHSMRLESHIDTPPNGDLATTMTPRTLTLEVADSATDASQGGVSSQYRLWEATGEFGLSGNFKICGKKRTLFLEDDMLQWYQKGKERDRGQYNHYLWSDYLRFNYDRDNSRKYLTFVSLYDLLANI